MFTRSRRWFAAALAVSAFCLLSASSSSSPESRSLSDTSDIGAWDRAQELGFRIVHAVHVPGKDRVMTWGYSLNSSTLMHEIDPAPATFEVEDGVGVTSSFCAGNEQLADGRLFVVGGVGQNNESAIYDQWADVWYKVASMKGLRYYPSATTLPDGRVFVTGGAGNKTNTVEIYDPKSDSWDSKSVRPAPVLGHYYPRIFVLPSGKLGIIYIFGPPTAPYTYDFVKDKWTAVHGVDGDLLPVEGGPAVMYEPGKVMIAGHDLQQANAGNRATRLVDFTVDPPLVSTGKYDKAFNSEYNTLTILPDGTVLSVGGRGEKAAAVYAAELWNPKTEEWTTLAKMKTPIRREYHSVAVLLRDGRVSHGRR